MYAKGFLHYFILGLMNNASLPIKVIQINKTRSQNEIMAENRRQRNFARLIIVCSEPEKVLAMLEVLSTECSSMKS